MGGMMNETMSRRQQEIVQAALAVIGEQGMGKLTVRNVAKRVGFSEPAVYRHFPDKTSLLEAMLEYVSGTMAQHFSDARRHEESGYNLLERFLGRMFEEFVEMPALVPLLFTDELLNQDPKLAARVHSTVEVQLSRMTDLVGTLQQQGQWRSDVDADDAAMMILGTVRLSVVRLAHKGTPKENAARVARLLHALMGGDGV